MNHRTIIRGARNALQAVVFARQRVVRGWDDRALWSLDEHLARTLGQQLLAMAKVTHSYPAEGYPFEDWQEDLRKHGEALLAYHDKLWHSTRDREWEALYQRARQALIWVADNFPDLWD